MAILKDLEIKQDIFDLIDKFEKSSLFSLDIEIPPPSYPPPCTKIKMMKLSQDNPEGPSTKITIEDSDGIKETLELKPDRKRLDSDNNNTTKVIKAPLIGTFYASSSPDSEAYVKTGDKISKGMVICIIEAMKIMNEIESEYDGEIAEVLVQNGSVVEYGQPLFRLK